MRPSTFAEDDIVIEFSDASRFPFFLLSDGQRSMAATAADIAMRCAQLNPHLNGQALTETPGVVLIDEIDLHLHPRWQRRVVEDLCRTFPRVQFIATTHSPFIIQSIHRNAVIDLDREENEFVPYEERSIEDISEELMGVNQPQRSQRFLKMVEAAEQYYRAIENGGAESDATQMNILQAKLDHLEEPFADNPRTLPCSAYGDCQGDCECASRYPFARLADSTAAQCDQLNEGLGQWTLAWHRRSSVRTSRRRLICSTGWENTAVIVNARQTCISTISYPRAAIQRLEEDWTNLVLACVNCNATKGNQNESRAGYSLA